MDSSSLQIIITARDQATGALVKIGASFDELAASAAEMATKAALAMDKVVASIDGLAANSSGAMSKTREEMVGTSAAANEMAVTVSTRLAAMNAAITASEEKMVSTTSTQLAAFSAATANTETSLRKVATAAAITGIAVAGFIGYESVKAAGNFQVQMTKLVTTAGETNDGLKIVSGGILGLAASTGTSTKELSDAMYIIESAGHHAADGLVILKAAAQGAKAENSDLATVANAVTTILQDYHLHASDAATVTSKLVAAVGAGKTTFNEFTGALHSVAPLAAAAHISIDDIAGSMASMTVHGISAEQAAQNMADAIRHLQSPTGPMITELAQLGLTANDVSDSLSNKDKGLSGTLEMLTQTILTKMGGAGHLLLDTFNSSKDAARDANDMIKAMPTSLQGLARSYQNGTISLQDYRKALRDLPTNQAQLMQQYASLENRAKGFSNAIKAGGPDAQTFASALQKVTGDASSLNVALQITGENGDYTRTAIKKVSDASAEAGNNVKGWSEIQGNMNFKMQQAKESISVTGIAIGTALLPVVTSLFQALDKILVPLATWAENHRKLATTIVLVSGAILGAIAGMMIYEALVNRIKASEMIMASGRYIIAAATWAWTAAQNGLTAATAAFDALLDMMGIGELLLIIGLILTALIALGYGIERLIKHFGGWKKVMGDVASFAVAVWQPVSGFFERLWVDIKRVFTDGIWFIGQLWNNPVQAVELFVVKLNNLMTRVKNDFIYYGEHFVIWMVEAIIKSVAKLGNTLEDIGGDIYHNIKKGWDRAAEAVKTWFTGAWEDIKRDAPQWGRDIVKGIEDGLVALANYDINSVMNWLDSGSKAILAGIDFGKKAIKAVEDGWKQGLKDTKQWGKDITNAVKDGIKDAKEDFKNSGHDTIKDIVDGLKENVKDIVDFFKHLPKTIEKDLKDSGKEAAAAQVQGVSEHWKEAETMKRLGEDILKGVAIAILAVIGAILFLGASIGIAIVNGIIGEIKKQGRALAEGVGWIINEMSQHWDGITGVIEAPFKNAFNEIVRMWNNSVGKLDFKAPSWVPGMGGKSWQMPKLPYLASGTPWFGGGNVVVGERGPEVVNLPQGSQVYSNANSQTRMNQPLVGDLHVTIQANALMGNTNEAQQFATQIYQQLQLIARRHGQAAALPSIGILPV